MKRLLIIFLIVGAAAAAQAEERYVTDQLKVTFRAGEGTSHKILKMLTSGEPLEVLSVNQRSGWARCRTKDGTVGYILERFLDPEPSARDRLAVAEKKLADLQKAPGKISAQLMQLQEEHQDLSARHKELTTTKERLEAELKEVRQVAGDAIAIDNERKSLRARVAELIREVEDLKQENRDLGNEQAQSWFMIGGGVAFGGLILGWLLPNMRFRRRKQYWNSL